MENYTIERMSKAELDIAISWAAKEGWNPGLHDADCFYEADPKGFFAGKLDGITIAVGSAVVYDSQFAFCGFYIVDPDYRHQGYGLALTKARLNYVGERNAGIDGVTSMLDKYERLGYRIAHNNARYTFVPELLNYETNRFVRPLADINFKSLLHYDLRHFPAPRPAFLDCWIKQPGHIALGYMDDDGLKGYGVIRPCQEGYKIGPLFADSPKIATLLFESLVADFQKDEIYLDIPENNPHALALVNSYKMEKVFETARMYLKSPPKLPIEHIYGITTFELG